MAIGANRGEVGLVALVVRHVERGEVFGGKWNGVTVLAVHVILTVFMTALIVGCVIGVVPWKWGMLRVFHQLQNLVFLSIVSGEVSSLQC